MIGDCTEDGALKTDLLCKDNTLKFHISAHMALAEWGTEEAQVVLRKVELKA